MALSASESYREINKVFSTLSLGIDSIWQNNNSLDAHMLLHIAVQLIWTPYFSKAVLYLMIGSYYEAYTNSAKSKCHQRINASQGPGGLR